MSDQDKPNDGSLVPAGRRDLAPVAPSNPLVSRGRADLARIVCVPKAESTLTGPAKKYSGKLLNLYTMARMKVHRTRLARLIASTTILLDNEPDPKARLESTDEEVRRQIAEALRSLLDNDQYGEPVAKEHPEWTNEEVRRQIAEAIQAGARQAESESAEEYHRELFGEENPATDDDSG